MRGSGHRSPGAGRARLGIAGCGGSRQPQFQRGVGVGLPEKAASTETWPEVKGAATAPSWGRGFPAEGTARAQAWAGSSREAGAQ